MTWIFTVITVLALVVLLAGERSNETLRNIAKPIASAGFLGVALSAGALDSGYGGWIFLGLMLGAAGDVLLLGASRGAFLAGLISFLLGHVAYVVGFSTLGLGPTATSVTAVVIALVAVVVFLWLRPHLPGGMVAPVLAYVLVISAMVIVAVGAYGNGATILVPVGALLFFVSDLFVARDRFVESGFVNRLVGLPLYYAGQILIAWSVATVL